VGQDQGGPLKPRRLRPAGLPPWALALPAAIVLTLAFVVPLLLFVVYAFLEGGDYEVTGELTLDNFGDALGDALFRDLAGNAAVTGVITGALSVVIGLALAYFIRFRAGRFELPLLFAVVLSMFASYLARIYAWRTILGTDGTVDAGLDVVGLPPQSILYTQAAVILALVHIFVPYVTLVAYAALRNLPRSLLELAADLGAGPVARWRTVVLPLVAPAATAGFLYTAILSASDYVTPQFLGGSGGQMVGVLIQTQFTRNGDFPLGAAMSLILLVLFFALYAAMAFLLRRLRVSDVAARY
jgi:spermidine/putrescine transport system permease protein